MTSSYFGPDAAPKIIQVVAHRGASDDAPEHTLAAYRKAIEDGADALECDVRLTADGHLVCVHDRRVNRTSDGRGAVSALELADLAALDFGSWKAPGGWEGVDSTEPTAVNGTPAGARAADHVERRSVLTLERLLELVVDADRRVELAIETKHPTRHAGRVEATLLTLLRRFGLDTPRPGEPSRARVMSFSSRSLRRIRAGAPGLPTVFLMSYASPRFRDGRLPVDVRIAGPSMRVVRAHPEVVTRLHQEGHRVHVWTVDDPQDVALCARLGVEAIITNRPRKVLEQLGRH
ncbi:glycerophosphodiester phosphodiesterase [Wenjunlia vitaminophila]|uniref:Glycerophosphodiester phosphodiesterase n=1 Tax=Wenjunlia vitaminophila TaxID=76728 RepID=A0A0T6LPQ1_WENVI|nr:glycerophosphodiester phosphodiesterase family protein [Wenjunlia vitaminophila]KRV48094.1 glycerophosphodiester phosphodiesterase [Wenjunlia vitaminophila]